MSEGFTGCNPFKGQHLPGRVYAATVVVRQVPAAPTKQIEEFPTDAGPALCLICAAQADTNAGYIGRLISHFKWAKHQLERGVKQATPIIESRGEMSRI